MTESRPDREADRRSPVRGSRSGRTRYSRPMSEIAERYSRIAAGFERRLLECPADRWDSPSPCTEWTARDVARHVVETHRRVMTLLDGGEARPLSPDEDLLQAWRSASSAVAAVLADDTRASTLVSGMLGEQPWEQLVSRLLCADTLVHTWDFARATGQDDRLDGAAVTAASDFLAPLDESIRVPGGFGPKLEAPEGADGQTTLLAFLGRR